MDESGSRRFVPTAWPRAGSPPLTGAQLRTVPEDFVVAEELGFPLSGVGEHVWLRVRKRGLNTDQVAAHLARHAGVTRREVSYSGLKDRHAVTEQWFSLWRPRGPEPEWGLALPAGIEILEVSRHARKLQRGAHRANRFIITLRECDGDRGAVEQCLTRLGQEGVPNYFGEQRFGREGDNLRRAEAMFSGQGSAPDRHRQGLYLSAARSWLFNRVLAARVQAGSWNRLLPGEAVMLDGKNSFFLADDGDDSLPDRLARRDIHPSGPLWGAGDSPSRGEARALEEAELAGESTYKTGLAAAGLRQERRALRLVPAGLSYRWPEAASLQLEFTLPRGTYATALLRELADYRDMGGVPGSADSGD